MAETTETTRVAAPRPEPCRPEFNPWLIAIVVSMAAFMEVLHTSIVNVALPHIAGALAASNSQSTRVPALQSAFSATIYEVQCVVEGTRFFLQHYCSLPELWLIGTDGGTFSPPVWLGSP